MKRIILNLTLLLVFGISSIEAFAQHIRYSIQQDSDNPFLIHARAIPDFSSNNVTISTAVFTFSVPASTKIHPTIKDAPALGKFIDHTGIWGVQKITPDLYASVGLNKRDLLNKDIYQVVLQNSPELNNVLSDKGIRLFSFELVQECSKGAIKILTNNSQIRNTLRRTLGVNFNNQISMSVDDRPSYDLYYENESFSHTISCPLDLVSNTAEELNSLGIAIQPNPTIERLQLIFQTTETGPGEILVYDIQQRIVNRQSDSFSSGRNERILELKDLAPGTYFLVVKLGKNLLQEKFIKINR